jgi:hypothetical protein
MRLNRGTLILVLVSLVVIAVVLVLNNNQASAPGAETTTPSAFSTAAIVGPLFTGLDQANVAQIEITDNNVGSSTLLTKGGTDIWTIASATYSTDRETDQAAASKAVTDLVAIQANDSFESDKLADFGLDNPDYVITITNADGTQNIMYVGNKNPAGNRNYILIASEAGMEITPSVDATSEATAETTDEATSEATTEVEAETTVEATPEPYQGVTPGVTSGTVYLVLQSSVASLTDLISSPPYVPAPTATPTLPATLNPLSEVEQATQTAEFFATTTAIFDQIAMTATAEATIEVTAEATAEVTAEVTDTP